MKPLFENWREFINESSKDYYHVTETDTANTIVDEGFWGSDGDVGFGVYFFGTLQSAKAYAAKGGWDATLENPAILRTRDERIRPVYDYEINPEWPNKEAYKDIYFLEGDENNEDERIKPRFIEIVGEEQ